MNSSITRGSPHYIVIPRMASSCRRGCGNNCSQQVQSEEAHKRSLTSRLLPWAHNILHRLDEMHPQTLGTLSSWADEEEPWFPDMGRSHRSTSLRCRWKKAYCEGQHLFPLPGSLSGKEMFLFHLPAAPFRWDSTTMNYAGDKWDAKDITPLSLLSTFSLAMKKGRSALVFCTTQLDDLLNSLCLLDVLVLDGSVLQLK